MGVFEIMDPVEGHAELRWDPDNRDEVEMARKTFEEATRDKPKGKGMRAYRMHGDKQGELADHFDPAAEHYKFLPTVVGG